MSSQSSRRLSIVVAILALCCCLQAFGTFAIVSFVLNADDTNSIAVVSTAPIVATASRTRLLIAPTQTSTQPQTLTAIVSSPTATVTRATTPASPATITASLYEIFFPIPPAPAIIYPIEFNSTTAVMTYAVSGKSLNEISASLDQNALADPHELNNRYYARTNWYIQGQWFWKTTPRGCEVDRGTVSIAVTITLPALKTVTGVPNDVLTRWNTFIRNTSTHEQGHAKLAFQGARDYQRDLGNFPPARDCDLIQDQLRDLYNRDFETIDRANIKYDKDTEHGLTQGAVFP